MREFIIPESLVNGLLNYLCTQPYQDVANGVQGLENLENLENRIEKNQTKQNKSSNAE